MNRRELVGGGLGVLGLSACQSKPLGAGDPLFVFKSQSPWRMVIGSESPIFALYDDGKVIYQRDDEFKSAQLDRRKLDRVVSALRLADLPKFAKHYEVAPFTDAMTYIFYVFDGLKPFVISVYGPLRARTVPVDGKPEGALVPLVPDPLIKAFDTAIGFDDPAAKPWLPDKVEVFVWPYDNAPQPSVHWPKTWPGLTDPATVRHGDSYSLYVPSAELPALQRFLATETEKGAVEIGGKKWSADLRYPFPKEQLWERQAPPLRT